MAIPLRCDVGDMAQIDAVVKATTDEFGRIDILAQAAHHNSRVGNLLEVSDEDIELLWTTGPRRLFTSCDSATRICAAEDQS